MAEFANGPAVLYFWAEWHEPSASLRQAVEALAAKHPSLSFRVIDADKSPDLCTRFAVEVVPVMLCLLRCVSLMRIGRLLLGLEVRSVRGSRASARERWPRRSDGCSTKHLPRQRLLTKASFPQRFRSDCVVSRTLRELCCS